MGFAISSRAKLLTFCLVVQDTRWLPLGSAVSLLGTLTDSQRAKHSCHIRHSGSSLGKQLLPLPVTKEQVKPLLGRR